MVLLLPVVLLLIFDFFHYGTLINVVLLFDTSEYPLTYVDHYICMGTSFFYFPTILRTYFQGFGCRSGTHVLFLKNLATHSLRAILFTSREAAWSLDA